MPIDNQTIIDKIDALSVKTKEVKGKRRSLKDCTRALLSIMEEEDPDSQTVPKAMKPIIDKGTGKIISPARRQEIYDTQTALADSLLT